jgi:uncharacterized membrane protein
MIKYIAAYFATAVVMIALDILWLGVIAKPLYQQGIGHLMADKPIIWAAVLFYVIYAGGLMMFAVAPNGSSTAWGKTLLTAALFGFVAYATYDLSNLATLKNWPVGMTLLDMAWGSAISALSAAGGKAAWDRLA